MPNYVRNIIRMRGIASEPLFCEGEDGPSFDFSKLVPMPESLNVESGSMTHDNIVYYLTERCAIPIGGLPPKTKALLEALVRDPLGDPQWPQKIFRRVMTAAFGETESKKKKRCEMGETYVSNYIKHGAATWRDWRCNNWGSQWNAGDTLIESEDSIRFSTAWSDPKPILLKLAERYPDRRIEHWWAGENQGSNTGYRRLLGPEMSEELHDCDDEAMRLYDICWG